VSLENMVLPRRRRRRIAVPVRMARPDGRPAARRGPCLQADRLLRAAASIATVFAPPAGARHRRLGGDGGWTDINPYPAILKRMFPWQERWLALHADAVTVASRTLETQVWGFWRRPGRVTYLPNGPDPALRDQPPATDAQKSEAAHSSASAMPRWHLRRAHPPRQRHGPGHRGHGPPRRQLPQARLVIAGLGDGLPDLRAKAQSLGVADQVVFPGWIPREQVPIYVAAADVSVNPYRDSLINRQVRRQRRDRQAMGSGGLYPGGSEPGVYRARRSGLLTEPVMPASWLRRCCCFCRTASWRPSWP